MNVFSRSVSLLAAALAAVAPLSAQVSIRSAGILGNSGETGASLVRFADRESTARLSQNGIGVDDSGFLWAFAGASQINRYSTDGRLLASYPLPKPMLGRGRQLLTLVGANVIICSNDKLWSLPVSAPAGTAPTLLPVAAKAISLAAIDGDIGVIAPDGAISVLNVATRQATPRGTLADVTAGLPPVNNVRGNFITLLPGGALLIDSAAKLSPEGGVQPVKIPGSGPLWLGGSLYAFNNYMTISRVDENGSPDPGVVYGGSSGSFIGKLPKDGEVNLPGGLVHLGADRYATVGNTGVIHLMRWDSVKRSFETQRRIGAIHRSSGLGLDRKGRVWWNCGYWEWTAGPADITRNTEIMLEGEGWQMVMLASDAISGIGYRNKLPQFINGAIDPEPRDRYQSLAKGSEVQLPPNLTGAAVFGTSGKEDVYMVDAAGKGTIMSVDATGRFRSLRGSTELKLTSAQPAITSLANSPSGELLAADGNALVRLKKEGETFTEIARADGWGNTPDSKFGAGLFIASDGNRLWIADQANNRVLLFTLSAENAIGAPAIFKGDEVIGALARPQRIAARGDRAVVVDWDNQRLVKLEASYAR